MLFLFIMCFHHIVRGVASLLVVAPSFVVSVVVGALCLLPSRPVLIVCFADCAHHCTEEHDDLRVQLARKDERIAELERQLESGHEDIFKPLRQQLAECQSVIDKVPACVRESVCLRESLCVPVCVYVRGCVWYCLSTVFLPGICVMFFPLFPCAGSAAGSEVVEED